MSSEEPVADKSVPLMDDSVLALVNPEPVLNAEKPVLDAEKPVINAEKPVLDGNAPMADRSVEEIMDDMVDEDLDPDYKPPPKKPRVSARLQGKDRRDFNFYRKKRDTNRIFEEREKKLFCEAIKQCGSKDWRKVASCVPTKSAEVVKNWIAREKRNQTHKIEQRVRRPDGKTEMLSNLTKQMKEGEEDLSTPDQRKDLEIEDVLTKQDSYAPIDKWLDIIETKKAKEEKTRDAKGLEKAVEFEKLIPMSLRMIAEFEKHPEPEHCGGIDYGSIYRYFGHLCEGEVPPDLNPESASRVTRLLSDLSALVQKESLEKETQYLENYRGPYTRFRSADNFDPNSPKNTQLGELSSVPGMNPLNFPLEMFCQRPVDPSKLAVAVMSPPDDSQDPLSQQ